MKPIRIECLDRQELRIGWDGEHNWRPIPFDCSWLLEKHPPGVISLWILPRGAAEAFPVALEQDGNIFTWTPTTAELGCGSGKLQFECDDGSDTGKSPVGFYAVAASLVTGGEHPQELPTWATQVIRFVTEKVEQVKAAVQEISGKITEALPDAIADYLRQHPITFEETDPNVPDWAKAETKPSYTAAEVGALSAEALPGAINEALDQAKTSGEFDGVPGAPGVDGYSPAVTITAITGGNRVTITDETHPYGQSFDVLDGEAGAPGTPGKDGEDYVLTEADKADIAALVDVESGVTPSDFPSVADITELWNSVSKRPTGAWEDFAWHQCPEAVRNYLANVDYDGVAYTESSIGDYAPDPAVPATNTKPIGQIVDGVTFYNTRPNGNAPYATANKSGTLNPLDQVRWIKSATNNMRDLGGWPCDGGTVKYGLLYRSGELNAQDEELLINQLGITTECDLTADGTPAYSGKMRFIGHTSYAMYSLANTEAWQVNLRGIFDAVRYGDPVVFHCSMGADRTGTLACILEGLLGVSQSDIDKDYELTSFYALRARNGNYQGGTTDWAHLIAQIEALSGDTFRDKVVGFVLGLGFTAEDINAFRHAMIDGTPEDITEPTQANLFDPNDSDVALRCRINSSGAAVAYADGQLVTGFIPASVGDVFRIETDKALNTNSYTGMMGTYTEAKGYIWGCTHASAQAWTLEDDGLTGIVTVLANINGHDQTGTAYVRFCIAYTDIGNIKIYKQ